MEQSSRLSKILKTIVIIDMLVVNVGVGYLAYRSLVLGPTPQSNVFAPASAAKTEYIDQCGVECQKAIKAEVATLASGAQDLPSPTSTPKPVAQAAGGQTSVKKKVRREEMMTVPGSGSTMSNDWVDLAETGFYFDTRDYPGLTEVYFEANMSLVNGNGVAYVRLFDITNAIGGVGSENDTTSQINVWTKSQRVYFWAGRNYIRVQAKALTAHTAVDNFGRLRIGTEN